MSGKGGVICSPCVYCPCVICDNEDREDEAAVMRAQSSIIVSCISGNEQTESVCGSLKKKKERKRGLFVLRRYFGHLKIPNLVIVCVLYFFVVILHFGP